MSKRLSTKRVLTAGQQLLDKAALNLDWAIGQLDGDLPMTVDVEKLVEDIGYALAVRRAERTESRQPVPRVTRVKVKLTVTGPQGSGKSTIIGAVIDFLKANYPLADVTFYEIQSKP